MTTQAVFFDLDDTLCDFVSAWGPAVQHAFAHIQSKYPALELQAIQAAWEETWQTQSRQLREPGSRMAEIRDSRFDLCFEKLGLEDRLFSIETNLLLGNKVLDGLRLFPDVHFLDTVRETWPIVIATNGAEDSHPDSQFSKADRLGLLDRVDGFFASDTLGVRKPDPYFLHLCAEQMGVQVSKSIYVGDNIDTDIVCANHAGMTSVLLWRHAHPAPELSGDSRPRVVIHSLSELVNWTDFS